VCRTNKPSGCVGGGKGLSGGMKEDFGG